MYMQNHRGMAQKSPSNYQLHEQIGSGQFSTVYRCTYLPTQQVYAIKCIPKYHFQQIPQLLKLLQTELRLLGELSHPNVIKLIDSQEDSKMFYIVYEYCPDGTLQALFSRNRIGRISAEQAIEYSKQMISALACLHQHSLLHRDIKPANILLCENKKVTKLSDFGFCKQTNNLTHTQLGTPGYMAPEMLNGQSYDQKADVYSLGVCLKQLIQNSVRHQTLEQYAQIIQQMIQRDPRARPTIQQVYKMIENQNQNGIEIGYGQKKPQQQLQQQQRQPQQQQPKQQDDQFLKKRCPSQPIQQIPNQEFNNYYKRPRFMDQNQQQQAYLCNQKNINNRNYDCNYGKKATDSPLQQHKYNYKRNIYSPKKNCFGNQNKENQCFQGNYQQLEKPRIPEKQQNDNYKNQNYINKNYAPKYFQNQKEKIFKQLQPCKKQQCHSYQDPDYIRQKYFNQRKYR